MDRRQIGTRLTLKALGLDIDLRSFNRRLILQKAIYLAQAGPIDLGYFYRWYLRGPYSPDLTDDLFQIDGDVKAGLDESDGWSLEPELEKKLERLTGLVPRHENDADLARELELLASVHYLVTRNQVPNDDPRTVGAKLKECNKRFTEEEVGSALHRLREHDLL